ncbi:hypothetical protein MAR_010401 [Mya arenaria]|uniref:Uncharacterized protein n=1 Tax=Mya arenaria TaxID=6604 RepID=A0ABY7E1G6_MYAAR|nr:hypothetical protein MAR_010401 [Mya arenaria]
MKNFNSRKLKKCFVQLDFASVENEAQIREQSSYKNLKENIDIILGSSNIPSVSGITSDKSHNFGDKSFPYI